MYSDVLSREVSQRNRWQRLELTFQTHSRALWMRSVARWPALGGVCVGRVQCLQYVGASWREFERTFVLPWSELQYSAPMVFPWTQMTYSLHNCT